MDRWKKGEWDLDTVKATLDCARADVDAEYDRMKVLDSKLSMLAMFSGLSVSIIAALGAGVLVEGGLNSGFSIALGAVLASAAFLLLLTTQAAFSGLSPKKYRELAPDAAKARVTPRRLREKPEKALATMASTYYVRVLPAARKANAVKLDRVNVAFKRAALGLFLLIVAILLTAVGSVYGKDSPDERDPKSRCAIHGGHGEPGPGAGLGRSGPSDPSRCDRVHRRGHERTGGRGRVTSGFDQATWSGRNG
jgi:hypothetical protein